MGLKYFTPIAKDEESPSVISLHHVTCPSETIRRVLQCSEPESQATNRSILSNTVDPLLKDSSHSRYTPLLL
jgi:hypothetical protein